MRRRYLVIGAMAVWAVSAGWSANAQEQEPTYQRYVFKKVGDQDLEIWIHHPPGWKASDKRPAIVFFYGGGWKGGSPAAFERHAVYFASRGLVCARPYYRVKGREGVNPDTCVEDARSAVRWMRKNAGILGIDPNKLIVGGSSAGGHLAACMIIEESVEAEGDDLSIPTMPQAMVLYNPVLDCTRERILERLEGDMEIARKISPTLHMDKDTPPAVIFFGSEDELKVHGDEYWEKAEQLGLRADKFIAEGMGHAFHYRTPWRQRCLIVADKFLESLGFLEGPPTMTVPEGEELEAVLEEERIRREQKKAEENKRPQSVELPLWQGAAPGSEKSAMVETHKDREISDGTDTSRDRSTKGVTKPTITVYLPNNSEGKVAAVLLCPGGGFNHLAIDKEGHDVARWLVSQGMAGIVLKYRMPDPDVGIYVYNGCVEDMHRALRLIRYNADEWKIATDKIGVMGFSAGGYLAALAGVNFDDGDPAADDPVERNSCRPDFITPVYPLISLSQHFQRSPEGVGQMLGPSPSESTIAQYSPEKQVSANTPPAFIVHANDDRLSAEHSVVFYMALRRAGVPAELHIYSTGGHGFGIRARGLPVSDWKDRWLEWMAARGLFSRQ